MHHDVFFELSQRGRADEHAEGSRSFIKDNVPVDLDLPLTSGAPVTTMPDGLRAILKGKAPPEDVPWCECFAPIISDRARHVLEDIAPGQVQFLPVALSLGQHRTLPYWLVNTLLVFDCFHRALSKWRVLSTPAKTWCDFSHFVLDGSRVPRHALIFRDKSSPTGLYVRLAVRHALERAAVTGAQFYPVDQVI